MYKYFTFLFMAIVIVQCQRPPYAGSSNRLPAVLPQYLPSDQSQSTVASSSIDNRINADDFSSSNSLDLANLPVDAHGDIELINRIQTWPREQQPFWYLNWKQIEQHRGGSSSSGTNRPIITSQRPFFAKNNV